MIGGHEYPPKRCPPKGTQLNRTRMCPNVSCCFATTASFWVVLEHVVMVPGGLLLGVRTARCKQLTWCRPHMLRKPTFGLFLFACAPPQEAKRVLDLNLVLGTPTRFNHGYVSSGFPSKPLQKGYPQKGTPSVAWPSPRCWGQASRTKTRSLTIS